MELFEKSNNKISTYKVTYVFASSDGRSSANKEMYSYCLFYSEEPMNSFRFAKCMLTAGCLAQFVCLSSCG